jgi:hypothetical protein
MMEIRIERRQGENILAVMKVAQLEKQQLE